MKGVWVTISPFNSLAHKINTYTGFSVFVCWRQKGKHIIQGFLGVWHVISDLLPEGWVIPGIAYSATNTNQCQAKQLPQNTTSAKNERTLHSLALCPHTNKKLVSVWSLYAGTLCWRAYFFGGGPGILAAADGGRLAAGWGGLACVFIRLAACFCRARCCNLPLHCIWTMWDWY